MIHQKQVEENEFYDRYARAKKDKIEGKINYIPFYESLPKLSSEFPGLIPGSYTIISASKGDGKTKFTKFISIFIPYLFKKNNPNLDFDFTVIWNGLEESEQEFKDELMVVYLSQIHGVRVSPLDLNGYSKEPLSDEILELTKQGKDWVEGLMKHIILIRSHNPTGFFKDCVKILAKLGKLYVDGVEFIVNSKNWQRIPKNAMYVKNNPNHVVVPVFDHVGLMRAESSKSWYECAELLSGYFMRTELSIRFQSSPILIQQRQATSQTTAYDFKGKVVLHKIEPRITDLGKITTTADDALTVIMIFNGARYELEEYRNYDLNELGHNQRFVFIRKNRKGKEGLILPLEFDGLTGIYRELPRADDFEGLEKVYKRIDKQNK